MRQSKKITAAVGGLLLLAVIFFIASQAQAQASLDFPSSFAGLSSQDLKVTVENIVRIVFGFLGILAVLLILYGGFVWFTSAGNEAKISQAKRIITSAVVGLVLILMSYAIAGFVVNSLLGNGGGPGGPGGPGGGTPPPVAIGNGIIESHYPGVNATDIPRNTQIIVTFKEAIDPATFNATNIIIRNLATSLTYQNNVTYSTADNLTFVIQLQGGTLYGSANGNQRHQVSLGSGIQKASGSSALALGYSWFFNVSSFSDTTPPIVTSVIPIGSNIDRNTLVQINFSEAVSPVTASGATATGFQNIKLEQPGPQLEQGTYTIANQYRTVEFQTSAQCGQNSCGGTVYCLAPSLQYLGTVTTVIQDLAGNNLAAPYTWSFSTNDNIDLIPPVISFQDPTRGDVGVSVLDPIRFGFSKPMSYSSLNSSNITLNGVGYWISAQEVNGKTEVSINHTPFDAVTPYTAAVNSGVKDIKQNCYYPCSCSDPGGSCGCDDSDPAPGNQTCTGTNCTSTSVAAPSGGGIGIGLAPSLCGGGETVCPAKYLYGPWSPPATYISSLNQYQLVVVSNIEQVDNLIDSSPAVAQSVVSLLYYNIYVQPRYPGWCSFVWCWDTVDANESWFLHDRQGARIYDTAWGQPGGLGSLYYMDVTNQAYLDFVISRLQLMLQTYPALDGFYVDGPPRWEYFQPYSIPSLTCAAANDCPTGPSEVWGSSANFYAFYVPAYDRVINYVDPGGGLSLANKYMIVNTSCASQFNAVSDGCLHEHAFHYWDRPISNVKSEASWLRDVQWLSDSSNNGRISIVFSGVNTTNMTAADRQQLERYEFASFLIGRSANSTALMAWSVDSLQDTTYSSLNDVDLGLPTGPYVQDWQGQAGVFERPYEKGIVLVHADNTGSARTVTLPDTYITLDGTQVSGPFQLTPNTGHILTRA